MSGKRNLNEASKEELVGIVKQLHMKLQQSQQSVSATSASSAGALAQAQMQLREHEERIQSLTEQSKLLKTELKTAQQEKQALMREVASLREKSKADEDTIKELIRQIEDFPAAQLSTTTPVAPLSPPQQHVKTAGAVAPALTGPPGTGESALLQLAESLKLRVRELEGDLMAAQEMLREADETKRFLEGACKAMQQSTSPNEAANSRRTADPEGTPEDQPGKEDEVRRAQDAATRASGSQDEELRALRRRVRQLRADCEGQQRIAEAHRQEVQRLLYAQAAHVATRDNGPVLSAQNIPHGLDELTGALHEAADTSTTSMPAHMADMSPPRAAPSKHVQPLPVASSSRLSEGTGESASHRQSATLFHSQPSVSSSADDVHAASSAPAAPALPTPADFVSSLPVIQLRGATPREKKLLERIKLLEEHIHAHSVMDATKRKQWDAMEQTRGEMVAAFQEQIAALRAELASVKHSARRAPTTAEAPSCDVAHPERAPTAVVVPSRQVSVDQSGAPTTTTSEAITMTDEVALPTEFDAVGSRVRDLEGQLLQLTTEKQEREGRVRAALGSVQALKSRAEESERRASSAETALREAAMDGKLRELFASAMEERLNVVEECWLATTDVAMAAQRHARRVVREGVFATGGLAVDDATTATVGDDAEWLVSRLSTLSKDHHSHTLSRVAEPAAEAVALPQLSTVLTPKRGDEDHDTAASHGSPGGQNLFDFFSVPQTVHEVHVPLKELPHTRSTVVEFDPFA